MLQFFFNPWLLTGLVAVVLPVIVHLLVRRRYQVVDWGAMQFLSPAVRTRRRLQLQDVFLLLLRMALIAVLALALARPWIRGGLFSGYESAGSRDVVLIIDSSSSMSQPDGISTLHQSAIRRAERFLETLSAQDTVMLIEARDQPTVLLSSPTTDRQLAAERLHQLDSPAGFSDLHAACERAAGLLLQSSHQHRDIVVFTDRQRASWQVDQPALWDQFDDLLTFTAVQPRLWVLDCSHRLGPPRNLISVGRLELDPPVVVPGGTMRIIVPLTSHAATPVEVPVRLLVDGQPVAGQERRIQIAPGGDSTVEFLHRPADRGVEELTAEASLPEDELPVDNVAQAIALVRTAPRVLLIESSDAADVSQRYTFYAAAALDPPAGMSPWVRATVVRSDRLTQPDIDEADVVVCPEVVGLPPEAPQWLEAAVRQGAGLLIAVGPQTTADSFHTNCVASGLLPEVRLSGPAAADDTSDEPVRILASSLQADWLRRFAERPGSSLLNAVFRSWWEVRLESMVDENDISVPSTMTPVILLTNQAPLLLEQQHGSGTVLLLTTSLDARWSSLPGRPDFVAFLYEAVFRLTPSPGSRNVLAGEPLFARLDSPEVAELCVRRPAGDCDEPHSSLVRTSNDEAPGHQVRYDRADMPGVYRLIDPATDQRLDAFAVEYDRREDAPDRLEESDRVLLQGAGRMEFADSLTALQRAMYGGESVAEIWWLLLSVFLILLVAESWVTRRLVLQRHGAEVEVDDAAEAVDTSAPA